MRTGTALSRLLTLGALSLFLSGCHDREEATLLAPHRAAFTQVTSGPVVTTTADDGDGTCTDAKCTLRDAVTFASDGATITFGEGVTGTITLTGGIFIQKNLTITGPGASTLAVSGDYAFTPIEVDSNKTVAISSLTFQDGYSEYWGGAIVADSASTLTISDCVFTGNTAADGGAVATSNANLVIRRSTFMNDTSTATSSGNGGGGVFFYTDGGAGVAMLVERSTFMNNFAAYGGGLYYYAQDDTGHIVNSTFSGNIGYTEGGGVQNYYGLLRVSATTITGNQSAFGGGLVSYNDAGTPTELKNNIIWGNVAPISGTAAPLSTAKRPDRNPLRSRTHRLRTHRSAPAHSNVTAAVSGVANDISANDTDTLYISLGYNLIGATITPTADSEFTNTGDQVAVEDAKLGGLSNYGGPTHTHSLLSGSPAINAGSCTDVVGATVSIDQRGTARPQGAACDIGAFEFVGEGSTTPTFAFSLASLPAKTYASPQFHVLSYVTTNSGGAVTFSMPARSVGCEVVSGDLIKITAPNSASTYCIIEAALGPDETYAAAGPILDSIQIGKAPLTVTAVDSTFTYDGTAPMPDVHYAGFVGTDDASSLGGSLAYTYVGTGSTSYGPNPSPSTNAGTYSVTPSGLTSDNYEITYVAGALTINVRDGWLTIANIPSSAFVGGSFTASYTSYSTGAIDLQSNTTETCTVSGNLVSFIAAGNCELQASQAADANNTAGTSTPQSFTVQAFTSSCTYAPAKGGGPNSVTVNWSTTSTGVIKVTVTGDSRTVTKQMAPTQTGSVSVKARGVPTYSVYGGTGRGTVTKTYVTNGTCTQQ